MTFAISPNPTGAAAPMTETATTDASGVASKSIASSGWLENVYTVDVRYAANATCYGRTDEATLLIATPGQTANGAGWYTHPGNGRVNFGFGVRLVKATGPGTPNPGLYTGRFMLINYGKWRCGGTISSYSKTSTNGAAEGECSLEWWDVVLQGGLGDWASAQADTVKFTINFTDVGSGKKATDSFGIRLIYTPSGEQPRAPPHSAPQLLKSGDVKIS